MLLLILCILTICDLTLVQCDPMWSCHSVFMERRCDPQKYCLTVSLFGSLVPVPLSLSALNKQTNKKHYFRLSTLKNIKNKSLFSDFVS